MKIIAIVQARVSSSRLPGKVLKPIMGIPMLMHQLQRLDHSYLVDLLVVATSAHVSDDPLVKLLKKNKRVYYRGSLDDVLDRFYQAALLYEPEHVVRITGDCPVIDPVLVDEVIRIHIKDGNDYTSNVLKPSFPDGLDVEVMTFEALCTAWKKALLPSEREHVTYYIRKHPEMFRLKNVSSDKDWSFLRWTVDEQVDLDLIKEFYEELYSEKLIFNMKDILNLLDLRPELKVKNTQYKRNEGFEKSLQEDVVFLKKTR